MKIKLLLKTLVTLSFFQLSAQECYNTTYSGDGTYYGSIAGTSSGNCSIPISIDDYQYCAMNAQDYNNSEACDACIDLTGPNGSIILRVVDQCPECLPGDVDMSELAFSEIADVIDGRVNISWKYIECPLLDTIEIVIKEGSSRFWTAIQLRNLTHAISSLEYLKSDGTWQNMKRQDYNFFLEKNGITPPMTLRATSVLGEELIFENINFRNFRLNRNLMISTTQQFSQPEICDINPTDVTLNLNSYNITTTDNFKITTINSISEYLTNEEIYIYNLLGQKIDIETSFNNNTLTLNTKTLSSGVYILKIKESKNSVLTKKIFLK